jgi:hypothetical protein
MGGAYNRCKGNSGQVWGGDTHPNEGKDVDVYTDEGEENL